MPATLVPVSYPVFLAVSPVELPPRRPHLAIPRARHLADPPIFAQPAGFAGVQLRFFGTGYLRMPFRTYGTTCTRSSLARMLQQARLYATHLRSMVCPRVGLFCYFLFLYSRLLWHPMLSCLLHIPPTVGACGVQKIFFNAVYPRFSASVTREWR
jgi:hypothetical protein